MTKMTDMDEATVSLVEDGQRRYGRFPQTLWANPMDEFSGPRRAFEDFRTKEWAGFTLSHPDLFCSMIIQDAKYLASSELYVYDRRSGDLAQHNASRFPGGLHLSADLLHDVLVFRRPGYKLGYKFDDSQVIILVDIATHEDTPAVEGRLVLDVAGASHPLVVSSKLPGGQLYTNKIVYPASGYLTCGERRYDFDPARDSAILDEHKSHLPYRTEWTWGTFVSRQPTGIVGANFAARPLEAGFEEESCLWTPQAAESLSDITFDRADQADELAPWQMTSADGRLDVAFKPLGSKGVRQQLGVAEITYTQWFGSYTGSLTSLDQPGQSWQLEDVPGVCERMDARM